MPEQCGNCHFADINIITLDEEESPHLVCRRYPPQMVPINNMGQTYIPLVHDEEWCGEWAPDRKGK